ncbi:glycosyltransferase family 2 protein [Pararhodonellum marinum]|uniref:glycosyltransferase family 2 protein n=1 Tax=Pararhodonellum marinum TaxID=2755358 RepID=UPI00188FBC15|nr:glycosyltransferase [Pararhodonellum marinum]
MNRIPEVPPKIVPLPKNTKRPFFSVMIPVYNCAEYMVETLESVLRQDMGEEMMQIEVVDDCSTDTDVSALVDKIGQGRVRYFRQESNVGSLINFQTCINRAEGHWIHLFHGDDRVKVGFYQKLKDLIKLNPQAGAAFCKFSFINQFGRKIKDSIFDEDKAGILENGLITMAKHHPAQYVSMLVKREVYENLGGFYGVRYGEDFEMWVRIAKHYPIAYLPEYLAEYRKRRGAISYPDKEYGQNARDLVATIRRVENYLPSHESQVMDIQKNWCSNYCIEKARKIWIQSRDEQLSKEMLKLAWDLKAKSVRVKYRIIKYYLIFSFNLELNQ